MILALTRLIFIAFSLGEQLFHQHFLNLIRRIFWFYDFVSSFASRKFTCFFSCCFMEYFFKSSFQRIYHCFQWKYPKISFYIRQLDFSKITKPMFIFTHIHKIFYIYPCFLLQFIQNNVPFLFVIKQFNTTFVFCF